jgi:hypothetical protein
VDGETEKGQGGGGGDGGVEGEERGGEKWGGGVLFDKFVIPTPTYNCSCIAVPNSDSLEKALFDQSLLGPFYVRGTAAIIYPVDFTKKTQSR